MCVWGGGGHMFGRVSRPCVSHLQVGAKRETTQNGRLTGPGTP